MINQDNVRCPVCKSFNIKGASQKQVNGKDTTRQERDKNGWELDNMQQLYCHPADLTWFGCIMCNTEFDDKGDKYAIRKMHPFDELERIKQYVVRIRNGESKEAVFHRLSPRIIQEIESQLVV